MNKPATDGRTCASLASLLNWVGKQLGEVRHERRVLAAASRLVEITSPLHHLKRADLRLLKMAAVIHDVGRCVSDKDHPAIGARMIREQEDLGLTKRQRRALAYLTLRHRGRVPEACDDRALQFSSDAMTLRLVLAFLRAADTLDNRTMASPGLGFSRRGRRVRIVCRLRAESPKARRVFSRRKKFRLLEEMLDCEIEVAIEASGRLRAAA